MQHIRRANVLHDEPLFAKQKLKWGESHCNMQHIRRANVLHDEPLFAKQKLKWGESHCNMQHICKLLIKGGKYYG